MRQLLALILILILAISITAQNNDGTPSVEDLNMTATQLYLDQTATVAAGGEPAPIITATPDDFELQATSLIQTATAQAGGDGSVNVATSTSDDAAALATQLIQTATADAQVIDDMSTTGDDTDNSGVTSPMNITIMSIVLVVVVLAVVGFGFVAVSSRSSNQ